MSNRMGNEEARYTVEDFAQALGTLMGMSGGANGGNGKPTGRPVGAAFKPTALQLAGLKYAQDHNYDYTECALSDAIGCSRATPYFWRHSPRVQKWWDEKQAEFLDACIDPDALPFRQPPPRANELPAIGPMRVGSDGIRPHMRERHGVFYVSLRWVARRGFGGVSQEAAEEYIKRAGRTVRRDGKLATANGNDGWVRFRDFEHVRKHRVTLRTEKVTGIEEEGEE